MAEVFNPLRSGAGGISVAPAGASTAAALDGSCPQVYLVWKATNGGVANVRWGKGAQTAVATDLALVDGSAQTFSKQDATDLAVIGSGTLYICCGYGP